MALVKNKKIDSPLVSIAIITYNQKDFLLECIESCLSQDYVNFEIVIADDSSTDGTQEMLIGYKKRYPKKFVLILSKSNQGITRNSNLAHFACNGKYIAWIGGDDIMHPNKLSIQVEFMEKNQNCTICYHNLEVFDSNSNKTLYYFNNKYKLEGDVYTSIRYGTFNGASSSMVRKSKTPNGGFNSNIPVASDWLYWVESLHNGGTINYIDDVLGRYRRHNKNITNKTKNINQNSIDHLNSCHYILALSPKYYDDVMFRYANNLFRLRNQLPYFKTILTSLLIYPDFKKITVLFLFVLTFGKAKV